MIKINPKGNTIIIIKYIQFYNNNYYNRKTFENIILDIFIFIDK